MQIEFNTLKAVGSGDKEALSSLYQQCGATIYGLALRITESRDKASKVVVEVFKRLRIEAASYDPSTNDPFSWVMKIAKDVALESEGRSDQFDFFAYQQSNFSGHNLQKVLSQLDNKHRKVLELAFFRNMAESDIEAEMNIPVGTVATRLRIAIKAMRQILG